MLSKATRLVLVVVVMNFICVPKTAVTKFDREAVFAIVLDRSVLKVYRRAEDSYFAIISDLPWVGRYYHVARRSRHSDKILKLIKG